MKTYFMCMTSDLSLLHVLRSRQCRLCFVFGNPLKSSTISRCGRMEKRLADREEEARERERVEQEQMEVAEGLLVMNMPTCVAAQTERIVSAN